MGKKSVRDARRLASVPATIRRALPELAPDPRAAQILRARISRFHFIAAVAPVLGGHTKQVADARDPGAGGRPQKITEEYSRLTSARRVRRVMLPHNMGKMGNRERIARAAEEAQLAAAEKAAKQATKTTKVARPKRVAAPTRMKIVWDVGGTGGTKVKTFPYAEKAAAEAAAAALTKSTGRTQKIRESRVPME